MTLDSRRTYCSHVTKMVFYGSYAVCEYCEQFWELTEKGWVPENDPANRYYPIKKRWGRGSR